jgi:hypothetical protein
VSTPIIAPTPVDMTTPENRFNVRKNIAMYVKIFPICSRLQRHL